MGNYLYIASNAFSGVTITVYYPADNANWTSDIMQDYGGTINWVAIKHSAPDITKHNYIPTVTAPTCTEQGLTVYTVSAVKAM